MLLGKTRQGLEQKFFVECLKIISELGYDLYDLDYLKGSQTLRIFIQDRETKTAVIDDCVKIDRALTPLLTEEDWIPEALVLEVSSPGIYRNLSTKEHFVGAIGDTVSITIMGNLEAELNPNIKKSTLKAKKFRGELSAVEDELIKVKTEESLLTIKSEQIKKAHIDPNFEDLT